MPNLIRLDVGFNNINETKIYKPENATFVNLMQDDFSSSLCPLLDSNFDSSQTEINLEECENILIIDLDGNIISWIPEVEPHTTCLIQNEECLEIVTQSIGIVGTTTELINIIKTSTVEVISLKNNFL